MRNGRDIRSIPPSISTADATSVYSRYPTSLYPSCLSTHDAAAAADVDELDVPPISPCNAAAGVTDDTIPSDPTTMNRQGNDRGPQYASAIFYMDEEQKKVAEEVRNALMAMIGNGDDTRDVLLRTSAHQKKRRRTQSGAVEEGEDFLV